MRVGQFFIYNVLRRSLFIFPSQNPFGLKLPQLLSQYLYQTRKIDLPGIGSFTLDPAVVIPQESDKVGQVPATGITFKNANIAVPDDALISFIKEHTGKMKSLAAADLDFYLTTGKQLLNIGKPFYLEGIGTLVKNKEGRLDFTPGDYLIARLEEPNSVAERKAASAERKATSFDEAPREQESRSTNNRQALLVIGLLAGLVVIGWGGYVLYKRNTFVEPASENKARIIPDTPAATQADTNRVLTGADSSATASQTKPADVRTPANASPGATSPGAAPGGAIPAGTIPGGSPASTPIPTEGQSLYRFVILETQNKNRALRRYNQLLGYQLNVKMEQKDSTYFKLYFPIAAAIKDTAHIRDSLADVYASPHVRIER
jgi:hypothetical protein